MELSKKIMTIELPQGVQVTVDKSKVTIKGPKAEIEKEFLSKEVEIAVKDGKVLVIPLMGKKSALAKANTFESIIRSAIAGVNGKEFVYNLEIVYSHFPITVAVKGNKIEVNNLRGGKKIKISKIIGKGTKVEVKGKTVTVKGFDKQSAGQTAANIENSTRATKVDRRVFQDGVYIVEKASKV